MALTKVLVLGKLPPPYMGPAIATEIILNSGLNRNFQLLHLNTKMNESLDHIGKWSWRKVWRSYSVYGEMIRLLRKEKPGLVLIPFSQDTVPFIKDSFFILIARFYRVPVLLHLRGSNLLNWLRQSSALTRWYVKRIFSLCQGVIVLGNNLRKIFQGYFPVNRIYVVPNGSNYNLPVTARSGSSPVQILYLANLQASKGIEDVLLALVELKKQNRGGYELTIAGAWRKEEFRLRCMKLIEENGLPVRILPPQTGDDKFRLLAGSDIFVFTPREPEGHPWVIVEALASGLPVISTDQGAIVESVLDGRNGYIVKTNAPGEIAEKIVRLLQDAGLRKQMSAESRKHYEENFTEEKMVERLTQTFEAVMK